jgi:hypothetical protein
MYTVVVNARQYRLQRDVLQQKVERLEEELSLLRKKLKNTQGGIVHLMKDARNAYCGKNDAFSPGFLRTNFAGEETCLNCIKFRETK